jgi:hypothetical protein
MKRNLAEEEVGSQAFLAFVDTFLVKVPLPEVEKLVNQVVVVELSCHELECLAVVVELSCHELEQLVAVVVMLELPRLVLILNWILEFELVKKR